MILDCGCPGEYPDWHEQKIDLSHHAAHVLPIASFLHMPLAYEAYRQRQQQEIDHLELQECWPGFTLTRTGLLRGQIIRLLKTEESPSRHFMNLKANFNLHGFMHEGGIGTVRKSIREQQMMLLDKGDIPREMYMSYLTCPRCCDKRGGERILLLRRWKQSNRLAGKVSAR